VINYLLKCLDKLFAYTGVVTGDVVLLSLLKLRLQAWLQTETMERRSYDRGEECPDTDYVVDPYHQKIGLNPPRGFCSPYRWNIHPLLFKIYYTFFGAWTRLQANPL